MSRRPDAEGVTAPPPAEEEARRVATTGERKAAVRRLLLAASELQRAEGVTVDGAALRELLREVERGNVTEESARDRLLGLAVPATELEC